MNWQQIFSLAIVGTTAGIFVWAKFFRRRKFGFERDLPCSGCAVHQSPPKHSVIYHAQKGRRPEIIVKMK